MFSIWHSKENRPRARRFLHWILPKGAKPDHEDGPVNMDDEGNLHILAMVINFIKDFPTTIRL